MAESVANPVLRSLQRRWRVQGILYCLLLSIAVSLPLTFILHGWAGCAWWYGIPLFAAMFILALILFPYWRLSIKDTARVLDRSLPQLEESSSLLMESVHGLRPLQRLQAERMASRLAGIRAPRPMDRRLSWAGVWVVIAGVVCVFAGWRSGKTAGNAVAAGSKGQEKRPVAERPAPGVQSVNIRIIPPAYTGRAVRQQEQFNLRVEEGSALTWNVETNESVSHLQFIFNDSLHIDLKPADTGRRVWRLSSPVSHAGYYQVRTDDRLSDLYKIEVIRDEAPHIIIRQPKPYTVIDFGESKKVPFLAGLRDDYGIADAGIVATVASGSGEAVKFKEQALHFDAGFTGGQAVYDLRKVLDLDALGMRPGDELYFYCRAKDNHGQESRSDMYIITLPDTAQLMSLQGLTTGVDIKPEYFRSERQIIIETEQLLREKDTISAQAFKSRSNDLGIDQRLLRLRYGKFLGEEAEEGAATEGFAAASGSPADFSNADKVRNAFTDKHDNAEDATFFDPVIKQQLKATLTEMWNAELRLRTYQVQEALPYEYKALRLLKDLQQKSRAFVAKTGVKTTAPDIKKRLTGKLDEILLPQQHHSMTKEPSPEDMLRMALGVLEHMRGGGSADANANATKKGSPFGAGPSVTAQAVSFAVLSPASHSILLNAMRQLGSQASARPGEYLEGFQALRRMTGELGDATQTPNLQGKKAASYERGQRTGDIALAEKAIIKMLPQTENRPAPGKKPADGELSKIYFAHVNDPAQQK